MSSELNPAEAQRYSRQMLFTPIGERGQRRLRLSKVTIVGCGALGSAVANILARAGVGSLRIIDRDFIETNNLQRQSLFDEQDIASGLPKAEAAARKLSRINSAIEVEGFVCDVNSTNVEELCGDTDLILDGADNLELRYLINDLAIQREIPWVYGACVASEGRVMAVMPGKTACLRCVFPTPPATGELETCDTAGVIASIVEMVAALQAAEAMKIMIGRPEDLMSGLVMLDAWRGRMRTLAVSREPDCPCCMQRNFEFLNHRGGGSALLCGRNAVQVSPARPGLVDFKSIVSRLKIDARPVANQYMLRFQADGYAVTLFTDGRAIIQGTSDPNVARGVYARFIGT